MGALAALFAELDAPRRRRLPTHLYVFGRRVHLGVLGASSYFSTSVAQKGIASPWEDLIQSAALATGVEPALLKAVASAESSWQPAAVSSDQSSYGLMQLNVRAQGITVAQALDPAFAILFAAKILAAQLAKRGGDVALAMAAYNAGTSRANTDLQQRMAANTLGVGTYVQTVLDFLDYFRGQAGPAPTDDATTLTDTGGGDLLTTEGAGGGIPWLWIGAAAAGAVAVGAIALTRAGGRW